MRILFYEDPVTDQNRLLWRAPHVSKDAQWMQALILSGCDARMLINQHMAAFAEAAGIPAEKTFVVDEKGFVAALPSSQANANTLFQRWFDDLSQGSASDEAALSAEFGLAKALSDAYEHRLTPVFDAFVPDVIVTWAPAPHLRRMFPAALILHKETSLMSRAPFPLTYYLDPCGFGRFSFVGREKALVTDEADVKAFAALSELVSQAFDLTDNVSDLTPVFDNFDAVLLVAGHTNQVFFFDGACDYRSQAHLILDVLARAPARWAVVATEHPDCIRLTATEVEFISKQYANFIYLPQLLARYGSSQQLVRKADAVATVSSSIGAQALFWNKRLYAFGDSHLPRFDRGPALSSSSSPPQPNASNTADAAWWSFHYSYQDSAILKPGWLAAHLQDKLDHWRAFGAEAYFDAPIRAPSSVLASYEREIKSHVANMPDAPPRFDQPSIDVDVTNDRLFGAGWARAEGPAEAPYRWTIARTAELRLALEPNRTWTLVFHLGAHAGCDAQVARMGIGDIELASIELNGPASGDLAFTIPQDLVGRLETRVWLKAAQLKQPFSDSPPLALALGALHLTSASGASRGDEVLLRE